jgi:UDP-glucose 4-epimerase
MSTFLVTGAGGFIGSSLTRELLKDSSNTVVTIDNFTTGFKKNIPMGTILIVGDCSSEKTIEKLNEYKFDCIFHIAGQSSGEISFEDPVYDLNTNTKSTLLLLEFAKKNKCKKFIFSSTMSVYGYNENECVFENDILRPKSFYAIGKIASENYMRIFSSNELQCYALRLFNVFGPGQNMTNQKQGMVSIFLSQVMKNKFIHVKGSKERFRDFIYIDDVVNAFVLIFKKKMSCSFDIYNISTNKKTKILDLISIFQNIIPFDFKVQYKGNTPGDQFGIYGNNEKFKNDFNWQCKTTLDVGLKKMYNWYKNY